MRDEREPDEPVEDLDVPMDEAEDVKGGFVVKSPGAFSYGVKGESKDLKHTGE
ncbi:MAG: hypothetical protein QOF55_1426 [Thermoleophilaceae bacterium]|nr:hypothetical protein [Thermoleophilaceae bacterium]